MKHSKEQLIHLAEELRAELMSKMDAAKLTRHPPQHWKRHVARWDKECDTPDTIKYALLTNTAASDKTWAEFWSLIRKHKIETGTLEVGNSEALP